MSMGLWARFTLLVLLLCAYSSATSAGQCPRSGLAAPALSGTDLTGQQLNLSDYHGKWVFVDFWASWCNPCMHKLPAVVELHNELKNRGDFTVVSVSLDNSRTKPDLEDAYSQYGISFPVVYDGSGFESSNASNWCVSAIPSTFLIDPQGQIYASEISPEEAQRIIEQQDGGVITAGPRPGQTWPSQTGTVNTPVAAGAGQLYTPPMAAEQAAAFAYRMQLLDHAPGFGSNDLHQVQAYLPAASITGAITSFKLIADWVDSSGQAHTDEYRIAINADPKQPLMPTDVAITGDLHFYIDQAASAYVLEIAVPARYISLAVGLSRYDPISCEYVNGAMQH